MLSPRTTFQDGEAALAKPGKTEAACPEPNGLSSAPTQCPTAEQLPVFDDDRDAEAHDGSWDATAGSWDATALTKIDDEPALLEPALLEQALLELALLEPARRPGSGSAIRPPKEAPLRRLRSEAYWEQKAAAARRSRKSPWEAGVRQRRPGLEEGCLGLEAAATLAAGGPAGGGSPTS